MTDYKSMYYTLFNQISKTIEDLQEIQKKTEEMYMRAEDNCDEENSRKIIYIK